MAAETPPIRRGSQVKLSLQIHLADGTEILSSSGDDALDLTLGDGTLVTGLEDLLLGLRAGADERFQVDGSALYGAHDQAKIHWLGRAGFPSDLDLTSGQVLAFDMPDGLEVAGQVLEVEGDQVRVDFNHPLAGRSLWIHARIISVTDPSHTDRSPRPGNALGR